MNSVRHTVWILVSLWAQALCAQLSGTYTIGGKVGSKNFKSWGQFASEFNRNGVSGKVELTVKSDLTVDTAVILKQRSTNPTTSSNTLRIMGANHWVRGSAIEGLLQFVGVDNVQIKNLHFENTATSSGTIGIRISQGADSNTIDSCNIYLSGLKRFSGDSGAYVAFAPIGPYIGAPTAVHTGIGNTISNGHFYCGDSTSSGPFFGIYDKQGSKDYQNKASHNSFENNQIDAFYSFGIFLSHVNGERCVGNEITRVHQAEKSMVDSSVMGILCLYANTSNQSLELENNYIHDLPRKNALIPQTASYTEEINQVYGINLWYVLGTTKYPVKVRGNRLENIRFHSVSCGLLSQYSEVTEFLNNQFINVKGYQGYSYGMYANYGSDVRMEYNVFKQLDFGSSNGGDGVVILGNEVDNGNTGLNTILGNTIDSVLGSTRIFSIAVLDKGNWEIGNNAITRQYAVDPVGRSIGMYWYWPYNMTIHDNLIAHLHGPLETHYLYSTNYQTNYNQNIYNNTLYDSLPKSTSHTSVMAYLDDDSKTTFVGNIIEAKGKGSIYGAYFNTANSSGWSAERNTFYLDGFGAEEWAFGTNQYSNFDNWKKGGVVDSLTRWYSSYFYNPSTHDFRSKEYRNQNNVPANNISESDVFSRFRHPVSCDRGAVIDSMNLGLIVDFPREDTVCSGQSLARTYKVFNHWIDTVPYITVRINNGSKIWDETTRVDLIPGDTAVVDFKNILELSPWGKGFLSVILQTSNDEFSDDTITFKAIVIPSPGGISIKSSFDSSLKNIPVVTKDFWASPKGVPIGMYCTPPRLMDYTDYESGSGWKVSAFYQSKSGRTAGVPKVVKPTATTDLFIEVTGMDTAFEDSLLLLGVRFINELTGCDTLISQWIHQSPTPTLDFETDSLLCSQDTIVFKNLSRLEKGSDYLSYRWEFDENQPNDTSVLFSPTHVFDSSGNYIVNLVVKTGAYGFTYTKIDTIKVNQTPGVRFSYSNACSNRLVTFKNETHPISSNFLWDFGSGDTSTSNTEVQYVFDDYGLYTVKLRAEKDGCAMEEERKIRVFEQPKASFDLIKESCRGDEVTFAVNTTMKTSLFGVKWEFGENESFSTRKNTRYAYDTAGVKTIKLYVNSEFGCFDSASKTIVVNPKPFVDFNPDRLCVSSPTHFDNQTAFDKNVLVQNRWYLNKDLISSDWDWNTNWDTSDEYSVKLVVQNDLGCSDSVIRTINVLEEAKPDFDFQIQCSGDSVQFENNTSFTGVGELIYTWGFSFGDSSEEISPTYTFYSYDTITVPVSLKVQVEGGCATSLTKGVFVKPQPKTCDFVYEPAYDFAYFGVRLSPMDTGGVVGGQNGVDYDWSLGAIGNGQTQDEEADFLIALPADDEYKVNFTAQNTEYGCTCSSMRTIRMDRLSEGKIAKGSIDIFPNPAKKWLHIAGLDENTQVYCYDLKGKQMALPRVSHYAVYQVFSVEHFIPGLYFLTIENQGDTQQFRIAVGRD